MSEMPALVAKERTALERQARRDEKSLQRLNLAFAKRDARIERERVIALEARAKTLLLAKTAAELLLANSVEPQVFHAKEAVLKWRHFRRKHVVQFVETTQGWALGDALMWGGSRYTPDRGYRLVLQPTGDIAKVGLTGLYYDNDKPFLLSADPLSDGEPEWLKLQTKNPTDVRKQDFVEDYADHNRYKVENRIQKSLATLAASHEIQIAPSS